MTAGSRSCRVLPSRRQTPTATWASCSSRWSSWQQQHARQRQALMQQQVSCGCCGCCGIRHNGAPLLRSGVFSVRLDQLSFLISQQLLPARRLPDILCTRAMDSCGCAGTEAHVCVCWCTCAAGALQAARDQADKEAAARARHEDVSLVVQPYCVCFVSALCLLCCPLAVCSAVK